MSQNLIIADSGCLITLERMDRLNERSKRKNKFKGFYHIFRMLNHEVKNA